jgi:DNA-binding MarR family transcriptional regulator
MILKALNEVLQYLVSFFIIPSTPKSPKMIAMATPAPIAKSPYCGDAPVSFRITPATINTATIPDPPMPKPNNFCTIKSPHFRFYFKSKVNIKAYKGVSTIYSKSGGSFLENFVEVIDDAKALNSKIFSLIRLELLSNIAIFGQDGVSNRELSTTLGVSDGTLYANLKALEELGYIKYSEVDFEGKKLDAYTITLTGLEEWNKVKTWLKKFVECDCNGDK